MFIELGRLKDPGFEDLDPTDIDMSERISPSVFDQVVESAKILQEEKDILFERGDLVYSPASGIILEVLGVYDNRHRAAIRKIQLKCRHGKSQQILNAYTVLHLGYLFQAHQPYNEKWAPVIGDTIEDCLPGIEKALKHFDS